MTNQALVSEVRKVMALVSEVRRSQHENQGRDAATCLRVDHTSAFDSLESLWVRNAFVVDTVDNTLCTTTWKAERYWKMVDALAAQSFLT